MSFALNTSVEVATCTELSCNYRIPRGTTKYIRYRWSPCRSLSRTTWSWRWRSQRRPTSAWCLWIGRSSTSWVRWRQPHLSKNCCIFDIPTVLVWVLGHHKTKLNDLSPPLNCAAWNINNLRLVADTMKKFFDSVESKDVSLKKPHSN